MKGTARAPSRPPRSLAWPVAAARRAAEWIGSAPGTYLWLAILAGTSFALAHVSPGAYHGFLARRSTNLDQLGRDPIRVLVVSALWTSRPAFFYYFVVYHLVHVPAERWLGTRRWLAVVALAHVLATLLSEGLVWVGILLHVVPSREAGVLDIGVSYGLAGVIGVLAYRVARPWRWWYVSIVLTLATLPVATHHTFTDIGHLGSVVIGLGCRPLTRGRPTWNPAAYVGRILAGRPRRATRTAGKAPPDAPRDNLPDNLPDAPPDAAPSAAEPEDRA